MDEKTILNIKDVRFSYGTDDIIRGVDLTLRANTFSSLIGSNGAGKSTLLKLACGILKPSAGDIYINSLEISKINDSARAALIAYLPQEIDSSAPFRVKELVEIGANSAQAGKRASVDEMLCLVSLENKKDRFLDELSGGERKRAFIAMLLAQGAKLLLLDEPLTNLDIRHQYELMELLKNIVKHEGISVLAALHDLNAIYDLDVAHIMKEGRIIASGEPKKCLTPLTIKEAFGIDAERLYLPKSL